MISAPGITTLNASKLAKLGCCKSVSIVAASCGRVSVLACDMWSMSHMFLRENERFRSRNMLGGT